jgi:uroporphyrinogen-III synthase
MAGAQDRTATNSFAGLRVLALESRRGAEMAKLIEAYGGRAIVAPSVREVPRESNTAAVEFARTLVAGGYDMVIFLTGVGTRALVRAVEAVCTPEQFAGALRRITVVARGPKPVAALKELDVPVAVTAPSPNTWRELLAALDERKETLPLAGRRVAVQEYGVANPELLKELEARGAQVTRVPVYEWALPEDIGPLRAAVQRIARGEFDVALFTTSIQVTHLMEIAGEMGLAEAVRGGMKRMVIGSIGPTTTEGLVGHGLAADLEASQPRMGILVTEAAQHSAELLRKKR